MGLISDLTGIADSILGVRDSIGAVIQPVYFVTRTWSGTQPGDGTPTDVELPVLPSPAVRDLATDFQAQAAGNYIKGDLILRGISKQSWPTRTHVDCTTTQKNVERFYKVAGEIYNVFHVEESYITWNVRIRKASHTG